MFQICASNFPSSMYPPIKLNPFFSTHKNSRKVFLYKLIFCISQLGTNSRYVWGYIDGKYSVFQNIVQLAIDQFVPITAHRNKPVKLPPHIKNLPKFRQDIWPHIHDFETKAKFISATWRLNKELKKIFSLYELVKFF
jgi:hypothetical protein